MKKRYLCSLIILLVFVFSSLISATTLTKNFEKSYDFEQGGSVSVKSINGSIELSSWNKNKVEIQAEIKVKAGSRRKAEDLLEKVEIIIDYDSDKISIEGEYPRRCNNRSFFDSLFGSNSNVTIKYWIKVPKETDIDLKSTNGRVTADDITGLVDLSTTNGSIEASNIQGSVDAHTTNGAIKVQLNKFKNNNRIILKTVNGSVKLSLPDDAKADVKASTVNGSISTDFPLTIRGKFIKKNLDGEINGGGGRISLSTVNGSISIYER